MIRFESTGINLAGEKVYRLSIDGETVREGLTIEQAVAIINRNDEERLGVYYGIGRETHGE